MNDIEPIRFALIAGDDLFRADIVRVIERDSGIVLVATCAEISDAMAAIVATHADIVVLDCEAGPQTTIDLIALAKEEGFLGTFLVIAGHLRNREILDLCKVGVAGILCKSDPLDILISAIRRVHQGGLWLKDEHIKFMISATAQNYKEDPCNHLSDRERVVLQAVLNGQTSKQIAASIGVSESAVKSTLQHLFNKTGTRTRGQLIRATLERMPTGSL